MVQRVKAPPPPQLVLAAVDPVVHKVKDQQVQEQTQPGQIGDAAPELVQMEGGETRHPKRPEQRIEERIHREEERNAKQP